MLAGVPIHDGILLVARSSGGRGGFSRGARSKEWGKIGANSLLLNLHEVDEVANVREDVDGEQWRVVRLERWRWSVERWR